MKNAKYEKWLKEAPSEIKEVISQYDSKQIAKAFGEELQFGTAGIRGIMGYGTAFFNEFTILKAVFGYSKFLKSKFSNPQVVICTDNRKNNEKFMNKAISVLNSFNIRAIFAKIQPTPFVSFLTRSLKLDGAIIITASHNPKEYNGIKFYDQNGCQILPEENEQIVNFAKEVEKDIFKKEFSIDKTLNKKIPQEEFQKYISEVSKIFQNPNKNLKVVFGASNGTSGHIMNALFKKLNIELINIEEQLDPDPNFTNTPYPNPEIVEAFDLGIKKGLEKKADAIFLVDPDADRFALAVFHNKTFEIISGNEIGIIILYDILCKNQKAKGYFVYSNVSTTMAKVVAKFFKIQSYKTLTGFKWIGNLIEKHEPKDFLFGFEESNGCLIKENLARDKDSFQAAIYISNLLVELKNQNKTLINFLNEIKNKLGYFASETHSFDINPNLNVLNFLKKIEQKTSDLKLKSKNYLNDKEKNMQALLLEIFINEQNTILIRPSGTEPKIKIYSHYYGKTKEEFNNNKEKIEKLLKVFTSFYK